MIPSSRQHLRTSPRPTPYALHLTSLETLGSWKLTSNYAESAVQSKICRLLSGMFFHFVCQPPSEVNLLGLGNHPSFLPMARVHLSMLQKARRKICFFQTVLVIYLAHLGQDLCSQTPHSGSFACLASHPGLATCKGATFEVVKKGAKVILPKLCLSFGANGPRSLQQTQLTKKYIQLWDGYQPALSKNGP